METNNAYDNELIDLFHYEIVCGAVVLNQDQSKWFNEIEQFYPISFNRINWAIHKPQLFKYLSLETDERNKEIAAFLEKILKEDSTLNSEQVVIIGDGVLDLAYLMPFSVFIDHFSRFTDLPQHLYIWFVDKKKCLNFQFENNAYWG